MLRIGNACLASLLSLIVVFLSPLQSSGQTIPSKENWETKRDKHIREAILHLNAAGLTEDAKRLAKKLLASKGARVIDVSIQLIELHTKEMRQLGIDWQFTDPKDLSGSNFDTLLFAFRFT